MTDSQGREAVLDDLTELRERLKRAEAEQDNGAAMVAKYDIDCALERFLSIASEAEYGAGGVAPT